MLRSLAVIIRRIVDYFYEYEPGPGSIRPASLDKPENVRNFEERLNESFAQEGSSVAGKLYFLNLTELRDRYGERWQKLSRLIHACMQRVIERHITSDDFFAPWGDAYIVMFSQLSEDAARRKCRVIGMEVEQHLFGEDAALDNVRISSVVTTVEGRLCFRDMDSLEAVDKMLDAAQPRKRGSRAEGPTEATEILSTLRFAYRPVWNARRKFISCYRCLPVLDLPDGARLTGEDVLPDAAASYLVAEVDCRGLENAVGTLAELAARNQRTHLAYPIHYATLVRQASRQRLAGMCRRIPKFHRRFLIAEILGLPPDLPEDELLALAFTLRPFTRGICARLPAKHTEAVGWSQDAVFAVGLDLADSDAPESEFAALMERFVTATGRRHLRSYICSLGERIPATAAVRAGFDHVDGAAAAAALKRPGPGQLLFFDELSNSLRAGHRPGDRTGGGATAAPNADYESAPGESGQGSHDPAPGTIPTEA